MINAKELRRELSKAFKDLRSGELKAKEASELANIAGKMINSAKVQVEYFSLRKQDPNIAWLEEGPKPE